MLSLVRKTQVHSSEVPRMPAPSDAPSFREFSPKTIPSSIAAVFTRWPSPWNSPSRSGIPDDKSACWRVLPPACLRGSQHYRVLYIHYIILAFNNHQGSESSYRWGNEIQRDYNWPQLAWGPAHPLSSLPLVIFTKDHVWFHPIMIIESFPSWRSSSLLNPLVWIWNYKDALQETRWPVFLKTCGHLNSKYLVAEALC